ncbi:MAG: prolipoprotein diacylglyceryl transferase [Candidatus Omnitrophica bacterium]|nr:prolipoprotein diacylglyceryl transferase [Candidatus Omnitrophota bacterium]
MFPVICYIGPFAIYSYGLMLALAVMVASFLASDQARQQGLSKDDIYDLAFWVVLWGILGARLFYILLNTGYFLQNPLEIVMLQKGGLAWQGSLVAGIISGIVFIRRRKMPLLIVLDIVAPFIALGHAIGRIGCLFNGCCYGKPWAYGLYFPVWNERLHPTQIYMVIGELVAFFILRRLQTSAAWGRQPAGRLFMFYLMLSSLERFIVEFFRADHDVLWGGLSIFQYVCAGIIAAAIIVNVNLQRKAV